MPLFKSAITRGGSVINPDMIEINDRFVVFKKRKKYLIGYDTILIPFKKVASVELDVHAIGVAITITSFGAARIFAEHFSLEDAKEIKRLIENKI